MLEPLYGESEKEASLGSSEGMVQEQEPVVRRVAAMQTLSSDEHLLLLRGNNDLLSDFDHRLARQKELSKTALSERLPERWRELVERYFTTLDNLSPVLVGGSMLACVLFADEHFFWGALGAGIMVAIGGRLWGGLRLLHPMVRKHLRARKAQLAQLRKDLAAFQENIKRVQLVEGRTELFNELCAACAKKRAELYVRTEAFLEELTAVRKEHCIDPAERKRRKEAEAKLLHEQRELKKLADNLGSIVPGDSVGQFTKDLSPFVAALQALDKVGEEARDATAAARKDDRSR